MYVHSVRLVNYKSFGDYQENEIILEPKVTAIIGKNESGKSNVLDGLSKINFIKKNTSAFADELVNRRMTDGSEIIYMVTLRFSEGDGIEEAQEDTIVEISKNRYSMRGAFVSNYQQTVHIDIKAVLEMLGDMKANPMKLQDQDWKNYQNYYSELQNEEILNIPIKTEALIFLKKRAGKIDAERKEQFCEVLDKAIKSWEMLINKLPVFFHRFGDNHLKAVYSYEEVENELNLGKNPSSYSLLRDFVRAISVTNEDFLIAVKAGVSPKQESMREKINDLVNEKINGGFKIFYQTEAIKLRLGFRSGKVSFTARSNQGEALMITERSNGLRWYLEMFIAALANNVLNKNVIYLLDEPGISLHVNAQRELLRLFNHLAEQGNQVAYTTHSPYMLDTEHTALHRIRAVIKDADGFSRLYKTPYDYRIAPEYQQDTLAPVVNALGMTLYDTFGPAKNKINIVTEGMSDYIYVCTMAKILNIDSDRYAIIPSVGASNCVNICSILHGWGCKYIAVFDYDKAGVESGGEYMRKKMGIEFKKQYCYLKDVSEEEISLKSYKRDKYMIEDMISRSEIRRFTTERGYAEIDKTLTAKLIATALEDKSYELGHDTIVNFQKLFNRIFSYVS